MAGSVQRFLAEEHWLLVQPGGTTTTTPVRFVGDADDARAHR